MGYTVEVWKSFVHPVTFYRDRKNGGGRKFRRRHAVGFSRRILQRRHKTSFQADDRSNGRSEATQGPTKDPSCTVLLVQHKEWKGQRVGGCPPRNGADEYGFWSVSGDESHQKRPPDQIFVGLPAGLHGCCSQQSRRSGSILSRVGFFQC